MSEKKASWPMYLKVLVFGLPFTVYLTIKHRMWQQDFITPGAIILGVLFLGVFMMLVHEHKIDRARLNASGEAGITGLETLGLILLVRLIFNFQAVACFLIAFIGTVIWFFFYR